MKIAVLHWPTSSVGGINTRLQIYRKTAKHHGDTFHVFVSANQPTKSPGLYGERRRIRGGDSFIMVDGIAPHHANNTADTLSFLRGYDCVMLSFLCPHPTKAYGPEPAFLPLLKGIVKMGKPLIGYISDAYWDTYADFGQLVLPLCMKTLVAQKAYGKPLVKAGYPVQPVYLPFAPLVRDPRVERDPKRVVWTPQWKAIKGIHQFFRGIPRLVRRGFSVGLYNNGIEYYKMRLTREWKETVEADYFKHPDKKRRDYRVAFYGCLPLEEIPAVIAGAAFAPDFQGYGAKYKAYLNGSYNNTINEALYYGAVPVVHENMLKSEIPSELLLPISNLEDYPRAIRKFNLKTFDYKKAREFVEEFHNADRLYEQIFDKKVRRAAQAK